MKHTLYLLGILLILAGVFVYTTDSDSANDFFVENDPSLYEVISVSDGDTIIVNQNGTEERVRFIGIDTPELNHPDRGVQCFAREATEFTSEVIGDSKVRLQADPTNSNRDRFDRLLRYVLLPDGTNVNAEIVEQGFGFTFTSFNFEQIDEFRALEQEAREAERGLWSGCEIIEDNGFINTETIAPAGN